MKMTFRLDRMGEWKFETDKMGTLMKIVIGGLRRGERKGAGSYQEGGESGEWSRPAEWKEERRRGGGGLG